jgi:hypothetical protein
MDYKQDRSKHIADAMLAQATEKVESTPYFAFLQACNAADSYRHIHLDGEALSAVAVAGSALDQLAFQDAAFVAGGEYDLRRNNIGQILKKCHNYQQLISLSQKKAEGVKDDRFFYAHAPVELKKKILEYLGIAPRLK